MQLGFLRTQPLRRLGWAFAGLLAFVGLVLLLAGIYHAAWAARLKDNIGARDTAFLQRMTQLERLQLALGPTDFLKHMVDYTLAADSAARDVAVRQMRQAVDSAQAAADGLGGVDGMVAQPGVAKQLSATVRQYADVVTAVEQAQQAGRAGSAISEDMRTALQIDADGLAQMVAAIHRQVVNQYLDDLATLTARSTGLVMLAGLLLLAAGAASAALVLWRIARPFYALQLSLAEHSFQSHAPGTIWGVERSDEFGQTARLAEQMLGRSGGMDAQPSAMGEALAIAGERGVDALPQALFEAVDRRLAANTASVDSMATLLQQEVADRLRRVQDVQTAMARLLGETREQLLAQQRSPGFAVIEGEEGTVPAMALPAVDALQQQLAEMAMQLGSGLEHTGASLVQLEARMQELSSLTGDSSAAEMLQALAAEQGMQHALLQQLHERIDALAALPQQAAFAASDEALPATGLWQALVQQQAEQHALLQDLAERVGMLASLPETLHPAIAEALALQGSGAALPQPEVVQALAEEQASQRQLLQQLAERFGVLAALPDALRSLPQALHPVIAEAVAQGQAPGAPALLLEALAEEQAAQHALLEDVRERVAALADLPGSLHPMLAEAVAGVQPAAPDALLAALREEQANQYAMLEALAERLGALASLPEVLQPAIAEALGDNAGAAAQLEAMASEQASQHALLEDLATRVAALVGLPEALPPLLVDAVAQGQERFAAQAAAEDDRASAALSALSESQAAQHGLLAALADRVGALATLPEALHPVIADAVAQGQAGLAALPATDDEQAAVLAALAAQQATQHALLEAMAERLGLLASLPDTLHPIVADAVAQGQAGLRASLQAPEALLQALAEEQVRQHALLEAVSQRLEAVAGLPQTLPPALVSAVAEGRSDMTLLGERVEFAREDIARELSRLEPQLARAAGQLAEAAQAVQKLSGAAADRMGEKLANRLQPLLEVLHSTASAAGGGRVLVPAVELAEAPSDKQDLRRHVSLLTGQVVTLSQGAASLAREALARGAVAPPDDGAELDGETRTLVDSLMAMVDLLTDVARSVTILGDGGDPHLEARRA